MSNNYWKSKQSSSGPTSDSGKAVSSRNATKHGCCATETLILSAEKLEEFKSLESTWFRAFQPKDTAEVHLVHQLTQADWLLQRAARTVAEVEAQLFLLEPNPLNWTDAQHKSLARFLRYQTAHNNNVAKRRRAMEDHRKCRAAEVTRTQNAKDKAEYVVIAKTRLKTYQEKNQPHTDWGQHLDQMRQKAIALGFTPPPNPTRK